MKKILLALILTPILSFGQLSRQDSVWLPFKNMIGAWKGTSEGQPGKGKYERSYELGLNKKFIEVKNKSTYRMENEFKIHGESEYHMIVFII